MLAKILILFEACISGVFAPSRSSEITLLSIGIFAQCENEENRNEFNLNSVRYKEAVGNLPNVILEEAEDKYKEKSFFKIEFISYDVCNSTEELISILSNILLNETFFRQSKHTNYLKQNIFLLHAYVPKEMSKLIQEMTSLCKFVKFCAPVSCDENYMVESSNDYSKYLFELVNISISTMEKFDVLVD